MLYDKLAGFGVTRETHTLCELAADAGTYINNKIKGKSTGPHSTIKLSELLRDYAVHLSENPADADPCSSDVLWRRLRAYQDNQEITQTDELALKVALASLELKNADFISRERSETLMNFCLNLSVEIARYIRPKFEYAEIA